MAAPPPPPKSSHTGAIIAVVVVVILAVVLVGLYAGGYFTPSSTSSGGGSSPTIYVTITAVNWDLTGSSCSGDSSQSTTAGQTVVAGSTITADETLVNTAILGSCTFSTPAVTQGFTITTSNAPVTVNAGGSQALDMEIVTPTTTWTGVLTVSLSVTTAL